MQSVFRARPVLIVIHTALYQYSVSSHAMSILFALQTIFTDLYMYIFFFSYGNNAVNLNRVIIVKKKKKEKLFEIPVITDHCHSSSSGGERGQLWFFTDQQFSVQSAYIPNLCSAVKSMSDVVSNM